MVVNDIIFFLMLGLGIGSLYAMLGASIVVSYKGSGVINFAVGAMAMYTAFQFDEAYTVGSIQLPWVNILPFVQMPVTIHLVDGGFGMAGALIIGFLNAVLIGLMAHFLVFRPLRNAAPLGKVVGALGITIYLQGVALYNFGSSFRQPIKVLPEESIRNFLNLGHDLGENYLILAAGAILVGTALWFVYQYTRFGLATRAAASNEKGAVLLGYSPDLLASINWVIASVVAGMAAVFVGPVQGTLTPIGLTSLVVPALGAALVGGLASVMLAVFGGLGLGMVGSFVAGWLVIKENAPWFPEWLRNGAQDAIPLIAIVIVLFVRGKKLPIRGTVEEKRLPLAPQPVRVFPHLIIWSGVAIALGFIFEAEFSFALSTSLISIMLMLSYVLLTGYVGQISLAQLSLAGVTGFVMSRMMSSGSKVAEISGLGTVSGPGLPWPIAMAIGVVAAVVVGLLFALPALRIRGVQLAVVTIAAAIAIQSLYFENDKLTGLRAGVPGVINSPTFFGFDIGPASGKGTSDNPNFIIFCVVVLALLVLLVVNIRTSGTGRRFLSVRANERAAAAAGVSVARTKILAFGISAAVAGVAGAMLGFQQGSVSSASFIYGFGLALLAFAYLGGITSINGAVVGGMLVASGLVVTINNFWFKGAQLEDYTAIFGGIGLIVTAIRNPQGLAMFFQPAMRHAGNWLVKARGHEWLLALRKFGPSFVIGVIVGYIIWPLRNDSFSKVWMPLLGGLIGLFIRSNVAQGIAGARAKKGAPPTAGPGAPVAPQEVPA